MRRNQSREVSSEAAAEKMLEATRALRGALRDGDLLGLDAALAARQESAALVAKALARQGVGGARGLLEEVLRLDSLVLEEARSGLEVTRSELEEIGRSRGAKRGASGQQEPPQFVSRRA